ncbi:Phosphoethanolamine transferase eptB [Serratia rubidaea]|uniref:Phosphoethanolamine transferase eptB n=1 Tax=Serratia rubidaea TaxID=61652 RepID=A0A4U9H7W7_SERRU|nr:Phosphoethanolamine transferase eptB [Serratia rubidaea]
MLYTDSFIDKVIDQVRDKKAIVFYAADHGEIDRRELAPARHAARNAPPEQFPRADDGLGVG